MSHINSLALPTITTCEHSTGSGKPLLIVSLRKSMKEQPEGTQIAESGGKDGTHSELVMRERIGESSHLRTLSSTTLDETDRSNSTFNIKSPRTLNLMSSQSLSFADARRIWVT
jgi:hypothetical protein